MNTEIIEFIDVSYDELAFMPVEDLEKKISQNVMSYLDHMSSMSLSEKIGMREYVKETRKRKFRFSQEKTHDVPKERIQIALSNLAKLFRALNDDIKKQENSSNVK